MALGDAIKDELATYYAAACSIMNQVRRIRADVEEQIVEHEAPLCNLLLQKMQRLPQELRDMIYGVIFQDSAVCLLAEEDELWECIVHHYLEWKTKRRNPYRYLLESDYFIDNADIRKDMANMWFQTTKFGIVDPSITGSFLLRFPWSSGLQPLGLLYHVTLVIPRLECDSVDQTGYLKRFKSLFLLGTHTKITICVECDFHYPDFKSSEILPSISHAQSVKYLFPALVELRSRGYTVTVLSGLCLKFQVEPKETTVEGWTKKFEAAVEEARIKFLDPYYRADWMDCDDMKDDMEDASQKYISDSSQDDYYSEQEDELDGSQEDESDGTQEDDSDGEDESEGSQEDESEGSQE